MKKTAFALCLSWVFVSPLFGGALVRGQQVEIAPERARSAKVRLVMARTTLTGAVNSGTWAESDELLPLSEPLRFSGWINERSSQNTCGAGVAVGKIEGDPWKRLPGASGQPPIGTWSVDVQLEDARVDAVTLNLSIIRMVRGPEKQMRVSSAMRTVTLTPQQPYVVGVADDADYPGCDWTNVMVQLFAEPSSLAPLGAVLGYDLWLVHQSPRGERIVDAGRVVAREGDLAHVEFKPFTWPIPGTPCTIRMDLAADVRARIRENGLIDLAVTPQRAFRVVLPERVLSPNFSRGSGRKILVAKPNEAVEFVLPDPVEQFQNAPCGVRESAFKNFVDLGAFFKDHKTSLTLSVHKE